MDRQVPSPTIRDGASSLSGSSALVRAIRKVNTQLPPIKLLGSPTEAAIGAQVLPVNEDVAINPKDRQNQDLQHDNGFVLKCMKELLIHYRPEELYSLVVSRRASGSAKGSIYVFDAEKMMDIVQTQCHLAVSPQDKRAFEAYFTSRQPLNYQTFYGLLPAHDKNNFNGNNNSDNNKRTNSSKGKEINSKDEDDHPSEPNGEQPHSDSGSSSSCDSYISSEEEEEEDDEVSSIGSDDDEQEEGIDSSKSRSGQLRYDIRFVNSLVPEVLHAIQRIRDSCVNRSETLSESFAKLPLDKEQRLRFLPFVKVFELELNQLSDDSDVFREMDRNLDGVICINDFTEILTIITKSPAWRQRRSLDVEALGNGRNGRGITINFVVQLIREYIRGTRQTLSKIFEKFSHGASVWNKSSFAVAMNTICGKPFATLSPSEKEDIFYTFDANHDGFVSYHELHSIVKRPELAPRFLSHPRSSSSLRTHLLSMSWSGHSMLSRVMRNRVQFTTSSRLDWRLAVDDHSMPNQIDPDGRTLLEAQIELLSKWPVYKNRQRIDRIKTLITSDAFLTVHKSARDVLFTFNQDDEIAELLPYLSKAFEQSVRLSFNPLLSSMQIANAFKDRAATANSMVQPQLLHISQRFCQMTYAMLSHLPNTHLQHMARVLEDDSTGPRSFMNRPQSHDTVYDLALRLQDAHLFSHPRMRYYIHESGMGSLRQLHNLLSVITVSSVKDTWHHATRLLRFCKSPLLFRSPYLRFALDCISFGWFLGIYLYVVFAVLWPLYHDQHSVTVDVGGWEIAMYIFAAGYAVREFEEMYYDKKSNQLSNYFNNPWNGIDWLLFLDFLIFFITRMDSTKSVQQVGRYFLAANGFWFSLKFLNVISVWNQLGIMLRIGRLLLRDVLVYIWIFAALLIGFAVTFTLWFGDSLSDYQTLSQSILTLIRATFVDFDFQQFDHSSSAVLGPFLLTIWIVASIFLLMNLLLCQLISRFNQIQLSAEEEYSLFLAQLIHGYRGIQNSRHYRRPPPPLNLVTISLRAVDAILAKPLLYFMASYPDNAWLTPLDSLGSLFRAIYLLSMELFLFVTLKIPCSILVAVVAIFRVLNLSAIQTIRLAGGDPRWYPRWCNTTVTRLLFFPVAMLFTSVGIPLWFSVQLIIGLLLGACSRNRSGAVGDVFKFAYNQTVLPIYSHRIDHDAIAAQVFNSIMSRLHQVDVDRSGTVPLSIWQQAVQESLIQLNLDLADTNWNIVSAGFLVLDESGQEFVHYEDLLLRVWLRDKSPPELILPVSIVKRILAESSSKQKSVAEY